MSRDGTDALADRLARYLRAFGTDEIGVHLGSAPERAFVQIACAQAGCRIVGLEEAPSVVITADGSVEGGVVRLLKDEVDAAVPDALHVIVLRLVGDAPLAPTFDAYLDVRMIDGRDVWFDQVGASG